jgi:hypothetical protein
MILLIPYSDEDMKKLNCVIKLLVYALVCISHLLVRARDLMPMTSLVSR